MIYYCQWNPFNTGWRDVSPRNMAAIKFELLFTNAEPSATVSSILLEFAGEDAQTCIAYEEAGMTGGLGVGEGIPFQIGMMLNGTPLYIFQGIVNIGDGSVSEECDSYQAPLKRIASIDWAEALMQGITYLLLSQTPIPGYSAIIGPPFNNGQPNPAFKYNYKLVPFVQTIPTDIPQAITMGIQEITMGRQLYKSLSDLVNAISAVIGDIIGAGSVVDSPGFIPKGISDAANLLGCGVETAALFVAFLGNIDMFMNNYGLVYNFKYAMTASDLIHAGFDYINSLGALPFNFSFKSTIFDGTGYNGVYKNTIIMPKKPRKENAAIMNPLTNSIFSSLKNGGIANRGNEIGAIGAYGYYDYDMKKLLNDLGQVFNAKGYILNNTYDFEEQHYYLNTAPQNSLYKLPNVDKPGYNRNWPAPYLKNWNELVWNYMIRFQVDSSDRRTDIVYTGTECGVVIQPNVVNNILNVLPAGYPNSSTDITFPFALAKRKEYLSVIEAMVNDIENALALIANAGISAINAVISGINAVLKLFHIKPIPPLNWLQKNPLNALIGCMETSGDSWQVPKIFIGTPTTLNGVQCWKIDPNNGQNNNNIFQNPNPLYNSKPWMGEGYMSAYALMQQFHGLNLATRGNQWRLYKNKRFPLCAADFVQISNKNCLVTSDGSKGIFDKIEWNLYDGTAENVEYRLNVPYTNNLYETMTVDGN